MSRRPLIAGNWKMHTVLDDAYELTKDIIAKLPRDFHTVDILVCPPFSHLVTIKTLLQNSTINLGAQTMHEATQGAYTGEVSGPMLRSVGCTHVIIGHSERREYFKETNALINQKLNAAFTHNITPILCIGETLEQRESGQTNTILNTQLTEGLEGLNEQLNSKELIIAYEPVWAIGTGKVATPDQAEDTHQEIRQTLAKLTSPEIADQTRLLYGGSVKPENSNDLLAKPNIDGALVGGASLQSESFNAIINSVIQH